MIPFLRLLATLIVAAVLFALGRASGDASSDMWLILPAGWEATAALFVAGVLTAAGWLADCASGDELSHLDQLRARASRLRSERDAWRDHALSVSGSVHEWWTEALRQRDLANHYESAASRWRQSAHRLAGTDRLTTGQALALNPSSTLEQPPTVAGDEQAAPTLERPVPAEVSDG